MTRPNTTAFTPGEQVLVDDYTKLINLYADADRLADTVSDDLAAEIEAIANQIVEHSDESGLTHSMHGQRIAEILMAALDATDHTEDTDVCSFVASFVIPLVLEGALQDFVDAQFIEQANSDTPKF